LEVTSIQAERNHKRRIKVFDEFFAKTGQSVDAMAQLWSAHETCNFMGEALVRHGDWNEQTDFGSKSLESCLAQIEERDPVKMLPSAHSHSGFHN